MKALKMTIKYWAELEPYVQIPRNKSEYKKQMDFLSELMVLPKSEKDKHTNSLFDLLVKNIQVYGARIVPTNTATAVDVLLSIMEEHELTQSDLPAIGSHP